MDELFLLSLTPAELRTYLALRHLADSSGNVKATMDVLGGVTGYSRETLRTAIRSMEASGIVETHRTKRNLGRLYKNEYKLMQTDLASTAGTSNITTVATAVVTTKAINTSYLLGGAAPSKGEKLVNRWSDDDDVQGFGLLEPSVKELASKKISKKDPKTRHQRPQDEWTAADVASEFASRTYGAIRGIPGLVNTAALRGLLSANRTKFNVTASIEMAVMDKFFADERNIMAIRHSPKNSHGIFANAITQNIEQVRDELSTKSITVETNTLVASDGRKFDNSMRGRIKLEKYEEELRKG